MRPAQFFGPGGEAGPILWPGGEAGPIFGAGGEAGPISAERPEISTALPVRVPDIKCELSILCVARSSITHSMQPATQPAPNAPLQPGTSPTAATHPQPGLSARNARMKASCAQLRRLAPAPVSPLPAVNRMHATPNATSAPHPTQRASPARPICTFSEAGACRAGVPAPSPPPRSTTSALNAPLQTAQCARPPWSADHADIQEANPSLAAGETNKRQTPRDPDPGSTHNLIFKRA